MSDFMGLPEEYIEPLGMLAIAAGRIEFATAYAYRAFANEINRGALKTMMHDMSFGHLHPQVTRLMRLDLVAKVDAELPPDWKEWCKPAVAFMENRNAWLHATWVQIEGQHIPMSLTYKSKSPGPVTAEQIRSAAAEGAELSTKGNLLAERIRAVTNSDIYRLGDTPTPDLWDWI